jgi:single stranded DNA-binding protein (ssb)
VNVCTFIGRIGKDAEVRATPGGKTVAVWSVAVDVGYGERKSTMWLNCEKWGDTVKNLAQYIRKGDRIGVTGELNVREYEGAKGKGFSVDLNVRDVELMKQTATQPQTEKPVDAPSTGGDPFKDDIPFAPCEHMSLA